MKIITIRAGVVEKCSNCNSTYELDKSEILCKEDFIATMQHYGISEFLAFWECPVCNEKTHKDLSLLPREWREEILSRRI